jgi:diguanylate cyclase (GGDEF)-like protein
MDHDLDREVAFVGQRVKQKICVALTLSSVIPLLILTYAIYTSVYSHLDPVGGYRDLLWFEALVIFTGLLMAAGGFVVWDLVSAVARTAEMVTEAQRVEGFSAARHDEVGTLMNSFSRMLATIEDQASEINQFAQRLEGAYKELEFTNARLKEFSFKDDVTGLYNRRFFTIRLEEEASRFRRFNHPVSVVLLDLDGFKRVNDELGHGAGDDTLRVMADLLLKYSRGINVICRWGGDEFAVLLVETTKAGAQLYAERLRQVLAAYPFAHGRQITASFGIAALPEDVAPTAEEIIQAADEALYSAKRSGKNRVCMFEDITATPRLEPEVERV